MSTLPVTDAETHEDSGPITTEGLLRRRARQKAEAITLIDPPNRQTLGHSASRQFTYGEADEAVDVLAAFFAALGLQPGDRVVMQLPNFIALLGAWRAGLTVAAIPMLWRATEIARVCDALEPTALIGCSRFAEDTPAETLRDVAASRLSVRFVLGFGDGLPDGVGSLDDVIGAGHAGDFTPRLPTGPSLITFTAMTVLSLSPTAGT
jgi:non-ribosomal peptide synthetase component E (peptide arylation enzyme)